MTAYQNNDVEITIQKIDNHESKVNINGENLMWISNSEIEAFKKELSEVLDKYRI